MRWLRLALVVLCFRPAPAVAVADDPPAPPSQPRIATDEASIYRHRGIAVDVAALAGVANPEPHLASLRRQIDIVVEVKTRPEIAEFFLKVPTVLGPVPGGGPGFCYGQFVVMTPAEIPFNRVVLLHEFLHAYHAHLKPEQKRAVAQFYREAARAYGMPPSEYFLTNVGEFFAVTASIYLHDKIPRAPATRQAIQAAQPEYFKLLGTIFDPVPDPTFPARPQPARSIGP